MKCSLEVLEVLPFKVRCLMINSCSITQYTNKYHYSIYFMIPRYRYDTAVIIVLYQLLSDIYIVNIFVSISLYI